MSYDTWDNLWDDLHDERQHRIRDKRQTRVALAEIESRLDTLAAELDDLREVARIIITVLALGETTHRDEYKHIHGLCGRKTALHLVDAARSLDMALGELDLDYLASRIEQEGPDEPYPPEAPWDSASDAGTDHAPAVHDH